MTPLEILEIVIGGLSLSSGVFLLFWKGDEAISKNTRDRLSDHLKCVSVLGFQPDWGGKFISMFDRLFGRRHLSWPCFARSCVASLLFVVLMAIVWAIVRPNELGVLVQSMSVRGKGAGTAVIFTILIFNFIPDYLSLLETRLVIRWIPSSRFGWRATIILFLELVFSIGIFLFSLTVMMYLVFLWIGVPMDFHSAIQEAYLVTVGGLTLTTPQPEDGPSFGIPLYTTLLTSAWLWLFLLGGGVIRLISFMSAMVKFMKWTLPIDELPVRSIGEVAAFLTCGSFWVLAAVSRLSG
jgi:hypothetical protein